MVPAKDCEMGQSMAWMTARVVTPELEQTLVDSMVATMVVSMASCQAVHWAEQKAVKMV